MKDNNKTMVVRIPTADERKSEKQPEAPTAETKAPTLDEMQKKIQLQQEHLNKLNQLFADRERFTETQGNIKRFKSKVSASIKSGELETPEHRLIFTEKADYRESSSICVSTPEILQEFLEFIELKIKNKLQQLDANIVMLAA